MPTSIEETSVAVALARIEGKLDTALATIEGKIDSGLATANQKIDVVERENVDTEKRLRALESRSYVTPKQLYGVVLATITIADALIRWLPAVINH